MRIILRSTMEEAGWHQEQSYGTGREDAYLQRYYHEDGKE